MGSIIILILGVCALLAAMGYGLYVRGLLRRVDRMLDEAIDGKFQPSRFDESRLSRLESKLGRFLSSGALSRGRLEEDRKRLTETIGDLSHQAKTPIANLKLYADLLRENADADDCELLDHLEAQTARLDFLIQGLVKTSRLEAGVVQPVPRAGSVSELLEAVAASYAPKAEEKGLSLTWGCVPDIAACFDPKWTAEALGNLVDNAVKYTAEGGVTLSARPYELFCRIDVADTGPGIPEDEQGAIFHRFCRGQEAAQAEGVGIGLYLARQIVSLQGGYIKVTSTPGEGAIFSMFLPRTVELCQNR